MRLKPSKRLRTLGGLSQVKLYSGRDFSPTTEQIEIYYKYNWESHPEFNLKRTTSRVEKTARVVTLEGFYNSHPILGFYS